MQKTVACALAVAVTGIVSLGVVAAAESPEKEHAELAKALVAAKVSLGTALTAAAAVGNPISAKYEVEDGKLQLSVYTEKGGKFSEVVVDHVTGKVGKAEPITESEDLHGRQGPERGDGEGQVAPGHGRLQSGRRQCRLPGGRRLPFSKGWSLRC